jgi:hypothetical protein
MEVTMRHKITKSVSIILIIITVVSLAEDKKLPHIETFVIEPIELEHINIWVPAAKVGPVINNSCRTKEDCSFSCQLPATVSHTKTELCPDALARLLAEYTSRYHEKSLPLTIFNGWQWEYSFGMSQFDSVTYELPLRGGCWENSWEAVLTQTTGSVRARLLQITQTNEPVDILSDGGRISQIEVRTFNSMRTRNGYPKERQL